MRPSLRLVTAVAGLPLRVQTKLLIAFLTIVMLLIVLGTVGLYTLSGINQRAEELIQSERKIAAYRQVQHDTTSQLYSVSSALLVSDQRALDNAALRQLRDQFGYDLERLQFVAKDELRLLGSVREDYDQFIAVVTRVVELIRSGRVAEAREAQLKEARPLANRLERLTDELVNKAEADTVSVIDASGEAYRTSQTIFIAFALGAIALALALGRIISWSVTGPIQEIDATLGAIAAGDFARQVMVGNRDEPRDAGRPRQPRMSVRLGNLYQQLEAASAHKSAFLASMSHELRTPLNAIIGYSEMLHETAEDTGPDAFLPDLVKIRDAGKHLLALINDILDLSKIEAGKMDIYLERVHLGELVDEVRAIVEPMVAANRNFLETECPPLEAFNTDRTKLKQCLLNLLSNAAKFTHDGRVSLRVGTAGTDVRFVVQDTGIGMTEDQQSRLFQAFTQAEAATSRQYGGTGLGLAITRHFCDLLGGKIAVETAFGRGSTFIITLPNAGSAAQAAPAIPQGAEDAALVMVVDDDPIARDLLAAVVRGEGYRVLEAADGETALTLAHTWHPDIITLDVLMPRVDGWSVMTALKSDPVLAATPAIIVTVLDERARAVSLGAAEFMTKPVDRARLAATLRRQVHGRGHGVVLVIDDEKESRLIARRHLEKLGWEVAEAQDGAGALEWLARHPCPAMILLDLLMPGMNGFAFLNEIARRRELLDLSIVILTAMPLGAAERELLAGRTREVMAKGADDLAEVLRRTSRRLPKPSGFVAAG